MDIADQQDGGLMDYEVQNDDLMGLELAEMEEKTSHTKSAGRAPRGSKHGSKMRIPLGIQNKKFGILRRGSPHKRSSSSHDICTVGEKGRSRHHHLSSKKQKSGSSKNEGSMGSKNPSAPINEDTQLELSRDWERPHSSTPKGDVSEASSRTCVPY